MALREAGYERIVPILDDLDELEAYSSRCTAPLLLGVRERHFADVVNPAHPGGERFGLTQDEIATVARRPRARRTGLVVYHAMVGSQIEDLGRMDGAAGALGGVLPAAPAGTLAAGVQLWRRHAHLGLRARLCVRLPGLRERLMTAVARVCAEHSVPQPDLIGEFGRYTVASHNLYLLDGWLGKGQPGRRAASRGT